MVWKLLRLKPLKPFFFGKESVFTNTNYATSEFFPQQTQITGALRLYWMEQNNLMRVQKDGKYVPYEKKEEARKLVGNAGTLDFEQNDNLGALQSISPMFILELDNGCVKDALFEVPSDIVSIKSKDNDVNIMVKPQILNEIASSKPAVILKDYDVKKGFVNGLGDSKFWKSYLGERALSNIVKHENVFNSHKQVGITLDENKQTQEGMFYTKTSYVLAKEYEFGLLVQLDDALLDEKCQTLKNGIISLGADASMFRMEVEDVPTVLELHPLVENIQNTHEEAGTKVILLSDSILSTSIHNESYFQIVPNKVPFKMMQSKELNTSALGEIALEPKEHKPSYTKSKEKLLVPKGSVYYFKTAKQLEEAKCAYKKMGFNQYLIIT